jgi:hypothetical protein
MSSSRRPWYPWYPKDFNVDEKVQSLSAHAELVYRRALDVMWQANDTQLPNQLLKLCHQLAKGLSKQEFENAWSEIQCEGFELFKISDCGKWIYSKRLREEAQKIENISKMRSELGKKGVQAKAKAIAKHLLKPSSSHTDPYPDKDNRDTKVSLVGKSYQNKNGNCPYNAIIDLYHEILPTLPGVRVISETRKKQIKARWDSLYETANGVKSNSLDFWSILFRYISESPFLMGRVDPPPGRSRFMADLEWITKQANFIKIFEGKYHKD